MRYTPKILRGVLNSQIQTMGKRLEEYVKRPGREFTRPRTLTFETVIALLLTMSENSIGKILIGRFQNEEKTPSASAFVQQRQKLLPSALETLFHHFTSFLHPERRFCGYRLLAVDGSSLKSVSYPEDPASYRPGTSRQHGWNLWHMNAKVHDDLWASNKITSSMNQKAKARVYYDWLIAHCEYGYSSQHDFAYGALIDGEATCMGYAGAYQLLLALEDIEFNFIMSFSGDHGWNKAVLDGVTYHIYATWGDAPGNADKYFCMTEEAAWARFGGKPTQGQSATVEAPEIDWNDFEFGTLEDGEIGTFVEGDFEW